MRSYAKDSATREGKEEVREEILLTVFIRLSREMHRKQEIGEKSFCLSRETKKLIALLD